MMIFSLNADSAAELPLRRRRPSQFGVCMGGSRRRSRRESAKEGRYNIKSKVNKR